MCKKQTSVSNSSTESEIWHQEGCARRAALDVVKKYKLKKSDKSYVLYSYRSEGNADTHFEKIRGVRIRRRLRSINAHDEQKRFELRKAGHFVKVQNPFCGTHCQWRRAYKRGGTSVRSRSESIRDCAITRGNASSPIARQALRRPRILPWVGQRSKKPRLTKKGKTIICRTDNFVLLVVPGLSTNFWKRFVLYVATAGVIKFIFKSSIRAKWRNSSKKLVRSLKNPEQK